MKTKVKETLNYEMMLYSVVSSFILNKEIACITNIRQINPADEANANNINFKYGVVYTLIGDN